MGRGVVESVFPGGTGVVGFSPDPDSVESALVSVFVSLLCLFNDTAYCVSTGLGGSPDSVTALSTVAERRVREHPLTGHTFSAGREGLNKIPLVE